MYRLRITLIRFTLFVIFFRVSLIDCHSIANQCTEVHYSDVIMSAIVYQITGVSIVYSTVCSSADERKHQSSASLSFVTGNHQLPVDSLHKGPVTRQMFPLDDVIYVVVVRMQIYGLVKDCSISSALATKILQPCTKASKGGLLTSRDNHTTIQYCKLSFSHLKIQNLRNACHVLSLHALVSTHL